MTAQNLHIFDFDVLSPGGDLPSLVRKALRGARGRPLLFKGGMSAAVDREAWKWLNAIADADVLPAVAANGPIGGRGLALLLLADIAWIGPDALLSQGAPLLPELAWLRLGPLGARRFAFADNPLDCLVELGHCRRADTPEAAAAAFVSKLSDEFVDRQRRGWRAARHLPAAEALSFGGWLDHAQLETV